MVDHIPGSSCTTCFPRNARENAGKKGKSFRGRKNATSREIARDLISLKKKEKGREIRELSIEKGGRKGKLTEETIYLFATLSLGKGQRSTGEGSIDRRLQE